jgi:hypothetical protein
LTADAQADDEGGPERSRARFDPVAGMRAVADIQAEGLRAAGDLLERMLGSEPGDPGPRSGPPAGDYTALVDAWTDLLRRTIAGLAQPGLPGAVTVPVEASGVGPPVRLSLPGADSADGAASGEVWLHNGTRSAVGPLALRCGQLSDADGAVLDGAAVSFAPGEVTLPPRSSRAVVVSLAATPPPRPGTYRGTIQARGAPGLWLPLEVAIHPC